MVMESTIVIDIIAYVAGTIITCAGLPLVYSTCCTRETKHLSYVFLLLQLTGIALWLVYGIIILSVPMTVFNSIGLFIFTYLLIFKLICEMCCTQYSPANTDVELGPMVNGKPYAECTVPKGSVVIVS